MNKTLYKVIFNQKRGVMVAVAENATRAGKHAQDGTGAAGAVSGAAFRLPLLRFALMTVLGLAAVLPVRAAGIVADKAAPKNQQATILQTANGLPQVNIQTPTAGGVSVNQYRQFDVDAAGAVLNNSRGNVQTQLGGWIQGNPWLAGGEAKVIVNQVNSDHPSLLNGYIEVGGKRAEVVVANPAGIRVNGGGFINAAGATLTTGTPVINNGHLDAFRVRGGRVSIAGKGLDTSDADYTRILAEAAEVNAGIWARDLQVAAGRNDVAADGAVTAVSGGAVSDGLSPAPSVAIDTGSLGGMYAGKITLLSTDKGVGINNAGQLFAAAGGVALSADGKITNSGSIVASDKNSSGADAAAVQINAGALANSGSISAQGASRIQTASLDNSGLLAAAGELNIRNGVGLANSGQINGARLDIETGRLNNSGSISQTGLQTLAVSADAVDNRAGGLIGYTPVEGGTDTGRGGNNSNNTGHTAPTTATGNGSIETAPATTLPVSFASGNIYVANDLNNHGGSITANGGIDLSVYQSLNNDASLNLGKLNVSGETFDNTRGFIETGSLNSSTTEFTNQAGQINTHKNADIKSNRFNNLEGEIISGSNAKINTDIGNNQKGIIASASGLSIVTSGAWHNQAGQLTANQAIAIDSNGLNNQTGKITSVQNTVTLNNQQNSLNNQQGGILSGNNITIHSASIDNRNGEIQASNDVQLNSSGHINNQKALITAGNAIAIQTAFLSNNETQLANQGIQAHNINIAADYLNNRQGQIIANEKAQLNIGNELNNQQGKMIAANTLTLAGKTAGSSIAAINNQYGELTAGKQINLASQAMDNESGNIISAGNLDMEIARDYQEKGKISATGNARIQIQGTFNNQGILLAGNSLNLQTQSLHNTTTGELSSSNTEIEIANQFVNRGQIDGKNTLIKSQSILNLGANAKIYGDNLSIEAANLTNETENGKAGTIAARNRLDLGVQNLTNREDALIFSGGNIAIGGSLNIFHQAVGEANVINNNSATIESISHMQISAKELHNTNDHFVTDFVETGRERKVEYEAAGRNERLPAGTQEELGWAIFNDESDHLRTPDGQTHSSWHKYDYWRTIQETQVVETAPAKIIAGGNLTVNADELWNNDSQIVAGGKLTANVSQQGLHNNETFGTKIIQDLGCAVENADGTGCYNRDQATAAGLNISKGRWRSTSAPGLHSYWRSHDKGRDSTGHSRQDYVPAPEVSHDLRLGSFAYQEYATITSGNSIGKQQGIRITTDGITEASTAISPQDSVSIQTTAIRTNLPGSSLFSVNAQSGSYLIETDPRFANYHRWLGSDYMLAALKIDPADMHKRLGDGYYEQRLVNEQILSLTGQRYLDGYHNNEAQFQALMDNGITAAQTFNLTPGIALSAEQIARLTSDIVWLVAQNVTLPDGSVQTAYAPQVYMRTQAGDIKGNGALLAGNVTELNIEGNLHNNGTIAGRQALQINADTIDNIGGRINAAQLAINAATDINNTGGVIDAAQTLLLKAGRDINNQTTTTSNQNVQGSATNLNRIAGIYVTGAEQGTLLADAGRNINLVAAEMSNSASGGQTLLQAGNDIRLDTATVSRHQENHFNADNRIIRSTRSDIGSSIQTDGDLIFKAGNDIRATAAGIDSQGRLQAISGNDIILSAGETYTLVDDASKHTGSTGGGRKQVNISNISNEQTQALGSSLSAQNIELAANRDFKATGSNIIAEESNRISAGRNIDIEAAVNTAQYKNFQQETRSGLTGSLSAGVASVGYGKSDQRLQQGGTSQSLTLSQIGSLSGDTTIIAGKALNATAAQIAAGGNLHLQGSEVNLDAAHITDSSRSVQQSKQSGLSVGITYDPFTSAKTAYDQSMAGSQNSGSTVGQWFAHDIAVLKASQAAMTPLVVSGGRSKTSAEQNSSHTQAVLTEAAAGGNLNISATGGSIRSEGAQMSAEGNALLSARDNINLGFAADNLSQSADSSRSGFAIDSRDHSTPGGTFNDSGSGEGTLDDVRGSSLSVGGAATLQTESGDINILGSTVVAQNDLTLNAARDVNILASQNSQRQQESQISSGIGSAQISDTEYFSGWMKNSQNSRSDSIEQVKAQVGSLAGNVNIQAGGSYTQQVADVTAAKDLNIRAQSIDVLTGHDSGSSRQSERDVKIGSFAKVSSPLIDLANAAEGAAESKADDRTRALQGMAAAAQGYQLYNTVSGSGALAKVEAGVGFKTANASQNQSYAQSRGNSLAAGGNINLQSTAGDITLQDTRANAANTLSLDSARNITLESGQSAQHSDGKNSSAGVSVGVGASVGAQTGVYVYAEAGASKGKNRLDAQSHSNTELNANHIQISSQGDTTLKGATATANRIDADVKGRLNIESLQDTLSQESQQSGAGARVQASLGTAWEASGNLSQSQGSGQSATVNQQSGFFAGEGGYHINADSVHLKGGAIASTAPKEHNELTANSLTFENIQNHSSYEASNAGIGGGYGGNLDSSAAFQNSALGQASAVAAQSMGNGASYSPTLPQYESGGDDSTTYATLSAGRLNIGGKETTVEALGIHSDAASAHQKLADLPDIGQIMQKQQTVAAATADIAAAVQTYSNNMAADAEKAQQQAQEQLQTALQNNDAAQAEAAILRLNQAAQEARDWGIGGNKARALNAVSTLVTGALGGQTALQTATNTLAPYAAETVGKTFGQHGSNPNEAAQLLSHALIGGVIAYTNGGSFGSGATAAAGSEAAAKAITAVLAGEEAAKNPNLLSEEQKATIRDLSAAVGALVGGVSGGSLADAQMSGVVGRNAVENNQLSYQEAKAYDKELNQCKSASNPQQCSEDVKRTYQERSDEQLAYSIYICSDAANSAACHSIRKQNERDTARLKQEYEQDKLTINPVWDNIVGYTQADLALQSTSVEAAAKYWLKTGSSKPLAEWMKEQGYSLVSGINPRFVKLPATAKNKTVPEPTSIKGNAKPVSNLDVDGEMAGGNKPSKNVSSGGVANAATYPNLKAQLIGQEIAGGHAFIKHVQKQGEFKGLNISSRQSFEKHIENVVNNYSDIRSLSNGRTAYWHSQTNTVVIRNPKANDGGTAFQPKSGKKYFDNLK
ncbi:MAG: hemagglutinin repeat-containing protein [Neisseria sp.]|nr:hemagglutinin repeat-containing protein [Neisseria sp.]